MQEAVPVSWYRPLRFTIWLLFLSLSLSIRHYINIVKTATNHFKHSLFIMIKKSCDFYFLNEKNSAFNSKQKKVLSFSNLKLLRNTFNLFYNWRCYSNIISNIFHFNFNKIRNLTKIERKIMRIAIFIQASKSYFTFEIKDQNIIGTFRPDDVDELYQFRCQKFRLLANSSIWNILFSPLQWPKITFYSFKNRYTHTNIYIHFGIIALACRPPHQIA